MRWLRVPIWWWPYCLVLAAGAWSPLLPTTQLHGPIWVPGERDLLVNVAVFLPLGLGLRRVEFQRAFVVALLVAFAMEIPQAVLPRALSLWDPTANLVGAWLGRRVPLDPYRRFSRAAVALAAAALLVVLLPLVPWSLKRRPSRALEGWAAFPVALGGEPDGTRHVAAEFLAFSVHDRALKGETDRPSSHAEDGSVLRWDASNGLVLDGPLGPRTVVTPSLKPDARGVVFTGQGPLLLPDEAARHVEAAIQRAGRLGVRVEVRLSQAQPAGNQVRLITASKDAYARNWTLGLKSGRLVFRVRTPRAGGNALRNQLQRRTGALPIGRFTTVLASSDGLRLHAWIDGRAAGETTTMGRISPVEGMLLLQATLLALAGATLLRALLGWRFGAPFGALAGTLLLVEARGFSLLPGVLPAASAFALAIGLACACRLPPVPPASAASPPPEAAPLDPPPASAAE